MLDHRYERRRLASSAIDRYNSIGASPQSRHRPHRSNHQSPLEYWTNGTTTIILNAGFSQQDPSLLNFYPPKENETSHHHISSVREGNHWRMAELDRNSRDDGSRASRRASAKTTNVQGEISKGQQQQQQQQHVVRNSLIAGSVAGIASTLACHPFDVIRTKMQSAAMESVVSTTTAASKGSMASSASATTTAYTSPGPLHIVSQTIKNGGLRALYTGLALPLAAQAVYKATVFTVNNVTQSFLINWNTQERYKTGIFEPYSLTMTDRFICGFMGGGVNAALFVTPVEYVRNQLIRQHSKRAAGQRIVNPFSGPRDVIRHTLQSPAGVFGLWRGVSVTVARDSIGCGCFFYGMEWTQRYFAAENDGRPPSLGVTIFSGAVAGLAYWVASLPLDSVKTWVQSDMADSAIEAVKTSLRERGPRKTMERLLTGFQVAYTRGIPSAAITVTTYSLCYRALQGVDP